MNRHSIPEVQGPRCAVIFIASVYDWLFRAMIPLLRERYGTRFVFLTRGNLLKERFGDLVVPQDIAINMQALEQQWRDADIPDAQVFAQARENEQAYGMLYMRDILQQERSLATRFLANAPYHAPSPQYDLELAGLTKQINGYFREFETLVRENGVDLVFARPDSLSGGPLTCVAEKAGATVTFPDVAKYKDLITWAYGAYRGDGFLRAAYELQPRMPGAPAESADSVRYADKDFVQPDATTQLYSIAKRLGRFLLIRAAMFAEDVRDRKFGRRTSFWTEIRRMWNTWTAGRWLDRQIAADRGKRDDWPYVLYLLPVEPEFNTHSLAREFNNSLAIAQQLALCLPSGYRLVVKEHGSNIGNRDIEYYERLRRLPNVEFADHRVPGTMLAQGAALLVTISGTIGMEASLLGKPVLTFSERTIYNFLPNVRAVTSFFDLPGAVSEALAPRSAAQVAEIKAAGARFYEAIKTIGFPAPDNPLFKGSSTVLPPAVAQQALGILLRVHGMRRADLARSPNQAAASGGDRD